MGEDTHDAYIKQNQIKHFVFSVYNGFTQIHKIDNSIGKKMPKSLTNILLR